MLDVAAGEERADSEDRPALMLRAIANVMLGRGADALKDLASPAVANRNDATLWRALAQAQQGKWVEAREGFKHARDRDRDVADRAAAPRASRRPRARRSRCATSARAAALLNELETLGSRAELRSRACGADGARDGGARPHRRRADALSRAPPKRRERPAAAQRAAARDRAAPVDRRHEARARRSRSWRRSPPCGAATRPRSRRCSCSGASTPRTGAIATPSR